MSHGSSSRLAVRIAQRRAARPAPAATPPPRTRSGRGRAPGPAAARRRWCPVCFAPSPGPTRAIPLRKPSGSSSSYSNSGSAMLIRFIVPLGQLVERLGRHPGDVHAHPTAAERDLLGLQQPPLALAVRERPVGVDDPLPGHLGSSQVGERVPGEPRRRRPEVAVGADEALGDGPRAREDPLGLARRAFSLRFDQPVGGQGARYSTGDRGDRPRPAVAAQDGECCETPPGVRPTSAPARSRAGRRERREQIDARARRPARRASGPALVPGSQSRARPRDG